jgi:hypothetical protein
MGRQLAPVRRARELLLADRTLQSVIQELKICFGVSSTEAIAVIVVARSLNRYAEAETGQRSTHAGAVSPARATVSA